MWKCILTSLALLGMCKFWSSLDKREPPQGYELKRHVSKLLLLVPAEDQGNYEQDEVEDVKVNKVIFEDDVGVKSAILDEDDVCDAMAPSVSSSFNSPDDQKQYEDAAEHEEEVDEEPGGNVIARRRSPRFGHTNA